MSTFLAGHQKLNVFPYRIKETIEYDTLIFYHIIMFLVDEIFSLFFFTFKQGQKK